MDLTEVVREDQRVMSATFLRSYTHFTEEFRRYSRFFADFLAIGGFEYSARTGRYAHLLPTCVRCSVHCD